MVCLIEKTRKPSQRMHDRPGHRGQVAAFEMQDALAAGRVGELQGKLPGVLRRLARLAKVRLVLPRRRVRLGGPERALDYHESVVEVVGDRGRELAGRGPGIAPS